MFRITSLLSRQFRKSLTRTVRNRIKSVVIQQPLKLFSTLPKNYNAVEIHILRSPTKFGLAPLKTRPPRPASIITQNNLNFLLNPTRNFSSHFDKQQLNKRDFGNQSSLSSHSDKQQLDNKRDFGSKPDRKQKSSLEKVIDTAAVAFLTSAGIILFVIICGITGGVPLIYGAAIVALAVPIFIFISFPVMSTILGIILGIAYYRRYKLKLSSSIIN